MITNTAVIYGKRNTFVIDFVFIIILYTDNILVAFFKKCLLVRNNVHIKIFLKYFANIMLLVSIVSQVTQFSIVSI